MKIKLVLISTTVALILSKTAFSLPHQSGPFKVASIRIDRSAVLVRFNPALPACEGGDNYRMHARFPITQSNSKELTSALLTAHTSGLKLSWVWVSNAGQKCSHEPGESHILNLDAIEFQNK